MIDCGSDDDHASPATTHPTTLADAAPKRTLIVVSNRVVRG
ncbi:hypothetical protein [Mycobacterium sp.]